jgi:uncharacterized protein YutE (UPF0331/DUF86 family)
MVLKRDTITERLKELDRVLQELRQYQRDSGDQMHSSLSQRWIIERGLIAAASLILDIASHILAGQFGDYPQTYESSLAGLVEHDVISVELYQELKGLGGFRNILVHLYQEIDPHQVWESYQKSMTVFPRFAHEILSWLNEQK